MLRNQQIHVYCEPSAGEERTKLVALSGIHTSLGSSSPLPESGAKLSSCP